jgi:multidrug efflux system outer membrane protein
VRARATGVACVAAMVVAGCTLGPFYKRPELDVPAAYYRAVPVQASRSIADVAWWDVFDDPQLVALINDALRDNLDLAITATQIAEAQAQVTAARAGLFPVLSGELQATRDRQGGSSVNSFLAALALSWELDFWGRYRRASEAARANLLATDEGRNAVIASLVAGVAQQYLTLKGLRQRLDVVQRTADSQRDSLRLVTLLATHGVQSAAEVRQAESQLLTTETQVPGLERQIAQTEDALAVLLGQPPRAFDAAASDLPELVALPQVPVGVPSELLERRPDIRQAEQLLVASNANIGVARALFFPSISLTGTLGRASDVLQGLVTSRGQGIASVGAALNVPIFSGWSLFANLRIARARADQATLVYRRTILVALQEVSDALVAYDRGRAEAEGNQQRVAATAESLRLADLRFRSGVISYIEVLDAQRQLLSAQLDLNASQINQRLAAVQLYRALGGGWNAPKTSTS